MTEQPRTAGDGLDAPAILASLQDQIDELTSAVQAQQRTLNELRETVRELTRDSGEPDGGRTD